jgi:hypothetical protein
VSKFVVLIGAVIADVLPALVVGEDVDGVRVGVAAAALEPNETAAAIVAIVVILEWHIRPSRR